MPRLKRAPQTTEDVLAELQAKSRGLGAGAGHTKMMGWKASFKNAKPKETRAQLQAARTRSQRGK